MMLYSSEVLHKVTGFVMRQQQDGEMDLLVFQHPTAGVQLPAGTVEAGESIESAALREVTEETSLTDVRLVRHLGSIGIDLSEERRVFLGSTTLLAGPDINAPSLGWSFGRGSWCKVQNVVSGFAEILYEEVNLNNNPEMVQIRFSGWVPAKILTRKLTRHFYHFESTGATEERWTQLEEIAFDCYWTPLVPKPALVAGQKEWLDSVYEQLLSTISGNSKTVTG